MAEHQDLFSECGVQNLFLNFEEKRIEKTGPMPFEATQSAQIHGNMQRIHPQLPGIR